MGCSLYAPAFTCFTAYTPRIIVSRARSVNRAASIAQTRYACTVAGLAEAVSLVDERLVISKMQRHLLTKFLTLTFLCYLVSATTLLLQPNVFHITASLSEQSAMHIA